MSARSFTCVSCRVIFANAQLQRDHHKSEWHRYNLQRKVVELAPVTAADFDDRQLAQQQQQTNDGAPTNTDALRCSVCNKSFQSSETYASHMQSKRHLEEVKSGEREATRAAVVEEETDADDWEDCDEDEQGGGVPLGDCLFCSRACGGADDSLRHMSSAHGFFVPDADRCTDVAALLRYLGAKVGVGFVCLWCNERGRRFRSLDAVRKHMLDAGHCKLARHADALLEYDDFFDWGVDDVDADDDADADAADAAADLADAWQLVLPSGTTLGHRALARYYRQRLKPEQHQKKTRALQQSRTSDGVLSHYRGLGWVATTGEVARRRTIDLKFMHRTVAKRQMKIGIQNSDLFVFSGR